MSDLMVALRNADAAGDTEAANRIAAMIREQEATEPVEQQPTQPGEPAASLAQKQRVSELPELGGGLLAGQDPLIGAAIIPAILTATDPEEMSQILTSTFPGVIGVVQTPEGELIARNNETGVAVSLNKPGLSQLDIVQGLANALAFTPAGAATSIPKAIAANAATELAIQMAQQQAGGKDVSATEVAISGALGGAFKGAEDVIGAGYRAMKGAPKSEAAAVIKAGGRTGIPITTTDVLPPQTFIGKTAQQTGEKIPIAGTGAMREEQQAMRQKAVVDIAEKYGQFSYKSIIDSLKSKKDRIKSAAGSVLESTGNKLDDVGEIPAANTNEAIRSATDELTKTGVIQSGTAMDDLAKLVDAMESAPQTFTTLKENRTAFREIVNGADKAERSQLTSRAKGLLKSVETAMTKDMKSFAKENLTPQEFSKWNKANAVYSSEAKKLTKTRLKNVLDKGDVTPEAVGTMLFSQKPSELKALYSSLDFNGRSNARSAIISKVIDNISKRGAGITPNAFEAELKKFAPQVGTFFKGEEKKQLMGLAKALGATRRAQDAAIATPTGQQLIGAGTLAAAATDLGATILTGGTVGGIARLYESAPVRNALLALASVPKGSTAFEQALRNVQIAVNAAAQSERSE